MKKPTPQKRIQKALNQCWLAHNELQIIKGNIANALHMEEIDHEQFDDQMDSILAMQCHLSDIRDALLGEDND